MTLDINNSKIAVIGLGYVGLPLLAAFGRKYSCVGFDIQKNRIRELSEGFDRTNEMSREELAAVDVVYSCDPADLADCNVFIVTVPTPIDKQKRPDLRPLQSASDLVGSVLREGDVVIYESTVYPGATEEVCVPILEQKSGLKFNQDFFAGYSPERINPGDKEHRIESIVKVTSGSTPEVTRFVDALYKSIISAGTHNVTSIKVAEAAKVIENTQRDLNIALINELCIIFEKLGIDTEEVLKAAGSKWNFLPFRPGLVGGHCISVDPYYLTHKSQEIGYHPEVILAGRRINDGMGTYIAERVIKLLTQKRIHVVDSRILIMGLTFKENCPDLRNTRVVDVIRSLGEFNTDIDVYDPWVDAEEAHEEYGISVIDQPQPGAYDAVLLTVAHNQFREMGLDAIKAFCKPQHVIFDVKYLFPFEAGLCRL
ncbi:MAG: Vi polysaccharide biosynthesis UDP-N-acetylglucosamine C-6 dehydrogenase TviB [Gammaproteobacteria bacterium]|nr:Vi polysaccharide biosynthesis UDP-N-acetylglucosamine C-6 dehydrogenase TviB [Pseudomonadales bacterium]